MKFQIRHEIRGRMRIHVIQSRMSFAQADTLQYYLEQCESVISAKIQNRTEDVTICYEGNRDAILEVLKAFSYEKTDVPDTYIKKFRKRNESALLGSAGGADVLAFR